MRRILTIVGLFGNGPNGPKQPRFLWPIRHNGRNGFNHFFQNFIKCGLYHFAAQIAAAHNATTRNVSKKAGPEFKSIANMMPPIIAAVI
jgi:hypothetical protein